MGDDSMQTIRITEAQMTALLTAGVFDAPEGDEALLVEAIIGSKLTLNGNGEQIARIVNDLSNNADELSRELTGEQATWARNDSRSLANLYCKLLRRNPTR
jgi:hypothetical protein